MNKHEKMEKMEKKCPDYVECSHEMKEDKGFYGHMTHASLQKNENMVKVMGKGNMGLPDPKRRK